MIIAQNLTEQTLLAEMISSRKSTVSCFSNSEMAIEWIGCRPIHLVLYNFNPAYGEQLEVIKRLRKLPGCTSTPIVLIVLEDDAIVLWDLELPGIEIVFKPNCFKTY